MPNLSHSININVNAKNNSKKSLDSVNKELKELGDTANSVNGRFKTLSNSIQSSMNDIKNKGKSAADGIAESSTKASDGLTKMGNSGKKAGDEVSSGGKKGSEGVKGVGTQAKKSTNELDKMSKIGRRTLSMFSVLVGYNALYDIADATRVATDSLQEYDYWARRLVQQSNATFGNASEKTNNLKSQINELTNALPELQKTYKKVNMTQVAASTMEAADKYHILNGNLKDMSKTYAVASSAFLSEGRDAQESVLAVNDALDGEFRRLKEVGISQETLKKNGWNGDVQDKVSLIQSLNKALEDMGYAQSARDIRSLGEAWDYLQLRIGTLVGGEIKGLQPLLAGIMNVVDLMIDGIYAIGGAFEWLGSTLHLNKKQTEFLGNFGGALIVFGAMTIGALKLAGAFKGLFSTMGGGISITQKLLEKLGLLERTVDNPSTTGPTTTGGTPSKKPKTTWKEHMEGLKSNLGALAKVFVTAVVGISMAMATIGIAVGELWLLGQEWELTKDKVRSSYEMLREVGIYIIPLAAAMYGLAMAFDRFKGLNVRMKGVYTLAKGMAVGMGLVAEAIGTLIAPIGAIALLGYVKENFGTQIEDGISALDIIGRVLKKLCGPIGLLIIGASALGTILLDSGIGTLLVAGGIAVGLGLVAEGIAGLAEPLGGIALLGYALSQFGGEEGINYGIKAIDLVAKAVTKVMNSMKQFIPLAGMGAVDFAFLTVVSAEILAFTYGVVKLKGAMATFEAVCGKNFVTDAIGGFVSSLTGGQEGLISGINDLYNKVASLIPIMSNFGALGVAVEGNVQSISVLANNILNFSNALTNIKLALDTINFSVGGSDIGSAVSLMTNLSSIEGEIMVIMNFANNLKNMNFADIGGGVVGVSSAIVNLRNALISFINQVNGMVGQLRSVGVMLGLALPQGISTGIFNGLGMVNSGVNRLVQSVRSKVSAFRSSGQQLGLSVGNGFKSGLSTFNSTVNGEMVRAINTVDSYRDDFYNAGLGIGQSLTNGFQDGSDIHSPGIIANKTQEEMARTVEIISNTTKGIYSASKNMGVHMVKGYTGATVNGKTPVNTSHYVNTVSSNSVVNNNKNYKRDIAIHINGDVYGENDLKSKLRKGAEELFFEMQGFNGATGY